MTELLDARQLAAAERCADAVLLAGTTDLSVERLRESAGISKRTFHRWFPSKARWIIPVYAKVTDDFMTALRQSQAPFSLEVVVETWTATVFGPDAARSLELYRLIRADPDCWAVFLEVLEVSEATIADTLRELLADADGRGARVAAVAIVSSSRLALDRATIEGLDARGEFERFLTRFGEPLSTSR